ncbi:MAG: aminopeptidase P family protein [Bacteroidaceae bacterium]|nr:aminopeptidase P family protein [Bacteroidaceae bacterium]
MDNRTIQNRVEKLRGFMRNAGLDAFIVVSSDPHSSEYVADCWKSREWVSGFDGSAGTAVVTADKALLWTDSRYWLAAEKSLAGTGYELMKDGAVDTPSITAWLCANLPEGARVGIDGCVCSIAETKAWNSELSVAGIVLEATTDPFATIWDNRPQLPKGEAFRLPLDVCGESSQSKLSRLRDSLAAQGVDGVMLTMLDEVAWVTNLRGCDVDYNPVFVAYMLVTANEAKLFIESEKVNSDVKEYLASVGIVLAEYGDVWQALREFDCASLLMQPNRCNRAVLENLNTACYPVFGDSPVAMMKAVKNDVEIAGFKKAMLSEGVAMVRLLRFLKPAVEQGGITEHDVDLMLTNLRKKDADFRGLSFATIAAYGANAAIVHYEPTPESDTKLAERGFLLLDCGGQYVGGTTDITRTIPLGELTDEEREDYTRVLKGHISLAMAKFPKGTCGTQLDVLARQWLWQAGENYLHGTGHGVGHFLNVHEGPHQIRMNNMPAHLQPGMTVTNEPGLYKAGRHGIRIENTMLVKHCCESEFGTFYELEPLTLCPIDTTPVIPEILGADAIGYLNAYNAMVCQTLSPYLNDEERVYLEEVTRPI